MSLSSATVNGVKYCTVTVEKENSVIHRIMRDEHRGSTVIGFRLSERREDFLQALFDLFIKHPEGASQVFPSSWSLERDGSLQKYLDGLDVSDPAQVHSVVLYATGWSKRPSTNVALVRKHLKMYEEEFDTHPEGGVLFWDVSLAQWGLDAWKKLKALPSNSLTTPIIKLCEDPEYLDFIVLANSIPDWGLSSVKVRDIKPDRGSSSRWTNLPIQHKEFRDYILDLTVNEYSKIWKKIPKSTSAAGAISMADEILGRAAEVNTVEKALDTYFAVFTASEKLNNADHWTDLNSYYLKRHSSSANLLEIAKAYSESFSPRTMSVKRVREMNRILFGDGRNQWCVSSKQTDYLAGRLIAVTGSPRKAWDIIVGVYSSTKSLSFDKWEKLLTDWETYKDMPSDLAVYLL